MGEFKSGIITRKRCVLTQELDELFSDLLKTLNIDDTTENESKDIVKAELVPPNNEWWTDVDTWSFRIKQDIVPGWYMK